MKKDVQSLQEAESLVNALQAEKKWAISVIKKSDEAFTIQWLEHKKYISQDGKEFFDEVWTTKEGEMKLIQDLEPEHARNIIRFLLRTEREATQAMNDAFKELADELEESLFPGEDDTFSIVDESFPEPKSKTLH